MKANDSVKGESIRSMTADIDDRVKCFRKQVNSLTSRPWSGRDPPAECGRGIAKSVSSAAPPAPRTRSAERQG